MDAAKANNWSSIPHGPMWFDTPEPQQYIPQLVAKWQFLLPDFDVETLAKEWIKNGHIILDNVYSLDDITSLADEVESAWFLERPIEGLMINDIHLPSGDVHVYMDHAKIIELPAEDKYFAKKNSNWRIGQYHLYNDTASRIFCIKLAATICSMLFDRVSEPRYSLTFSRGSQQNLHQDTCVFHVFPKNALIGVWVALEDIQPDSGPLVYYPASHKEPIYSEFDNYPQTQRRTANLEQCRRYDHYVQELSQQFQRCEFLAKKGQALFWHGMLIHGGSTANVREGSSRKSFVVHYMPENADVASQVSGPFNW